MKEVYMLWHTHKDDRLDDGEDAKLIGVDSSRVNAEAAQLRVGLLEGFSDSQEGFEISCCQLDKDEWTSGFVTV
jgi:hypothetical protein